MKNYITINNNKIAINVAISDLEKERGLMFIQPPVPATVFLFNLAQKCSFWMKNTPAPLDILFCNSGKIIQIERGIPFDKKSILSKKTCDTVIELNAGTVENLDIKINDKFLIEYSIEKVAQIYREWYLKN